MTPPVILPDSRVFVEDLRAGRDPFARFAPYPDVCEFATCGIVVTEVCRSVHDPNLLRRVRERFEVMVYVPASRVIWERVTQLAWALDRRGIVLPATDLLIATCALHVRAAVLTPEPHFNQVPGLEVLRSLE
jgi:predicted nucleic acid-binding protein